MQAAFRQGEVIEINDDTEDEEFLSLNGVEAAFLDDDHADPALFRFDQASEPLHERFSTPDRRTPYQICLDAVLDVFPDISHDHVRLLYDAHVPGDGALQPPVLVPYANNIQEALISQILDTDKYPKETDRRQELKRKRSMVVNSDEEEVARWRNAAQDANRHRVARRYMEEALIILQEEFINIPKRFIYLKLKETGYFYATYMALELAEHTYKATQSPYTKLKVPRRFKVERSSQMEDMNATSYEIRLDLKIEMEAAKERRKKHDAKRQAERDLAAAEAANEKEHRENGDIIECQCCFDEYPINKVTHCNGDEPHFFCLECARNNAKNEIGKSRYELRCMDGSGCQDLFSREQRMRFLDHKAFEALERTQQQAEIRLAELKNLSSCPFCDFAAICPSIKVDREFRCRNPECEKTTCRLCKLESHTPLSCEEFRKESGVNERHVVEEARTEALLRTCPKCKVKILKEDGCNKVICPCGGWLCDFCGKDITGTGYNHFDGGRSAVSGPKCPTYDNLDIRRKVDIDKAEGEALKKVRAENPNLTEEDLKIKFAETTNSPPRRDPHAGRMQLPGGHVMIQDEAIAARGQQHRDAGREGHARWMQRLAVGNPVIAEAHAQARQRQEAHELAMQRLAVQREGLLERIQAQREERIQALRPANPGIAADDRGFEALHPGNPDAAADARRFEARNLVNPGVEANNPWARAPRPDHGRRHARAMHQHQLLMHNTQQWVQAQNQAFQLPIQQGEDEALRDLFGLAEWPANNANPYLRDPFLGDPRAAYHGPRP